MNSFDDGSQWPLGQRGPIRVMSKECIPTGPAMVFPIPGREKLTVEKLVFRVRADIGFLAITAVIYPVKASYKLHSLMKELGLVMFAPDAFVCPYNVLNIDQEAAYDVLDRFPGTARAVPLDFGSSAGFGVLQGIIADLLYIPAVSEEEFKLVPFWDGGSRAVIIENGKLLNPLAEAFLRTQLLVYSWDGVNLMELYLEPA